MTQVDSIIKGALLVYCIHVNVVLKEQAHDEIM